MAKNIITVSTLLLLLAAGAVWIALKPGVEEMPVDEEVYVNGEEENGERLSAILKKAEDISSLKYNVVAKEAWGSSNIRFWQKDNKMRMDVTFQGRRIINLVDTKEDVGYIYNLGYDFATKVELGRVKEVLEVSVKERVASLSEYDVVVLESENVDGKSCLVIKYDTEWEKIKMWIWEDYGIPVKIEKTTEMGVTEFMIENIEFVEIEDDVFELPPNVEITEESYVF